MAIREEMEGWEGLAGAREEARVAVRVAGSTVARGAAAQAVTEDTPSR